MVIGKGGGKAWNSEPKQSSRKGAKEKQYWNSCKKAQGTQKQLTQTREHSSRSLELRDERRMLHVGVARLARIQEPV